MLVNNVHSKIWFAMFCICTVVNVNYITSQFPWFEF